jgi:hypothetical protein
VSPYSDGVKKKGFRKGTLYETPRASIEEVEMQLRNTGLPIDILREQVLSCDAPYLIITGETGSGKTTRVPVWLLESGKSVLVAEPLTETILETSRYIADLFDEELGRRVGNYSEDLYGSDTSLLFTPANPRIVRELASETDFDVLIIDELHQWTTDQSVLEAWCWKCLQEGTLPFKQVILMSATLDVDQIVERRGNFPIFRAPDLHLEIDDQPRGDTIQKDIQRLVADGHDVLVFMPTWTSIVRLRDSLKGIDAELLPFHSRRSTNEEKNLVYESYDRPKVIIATNALETGVTINPSPGRNLAVVDSGLEVQVVLGPGKVEQRQIMPISLMQSKQRRGRTGRVGKGIYVDHCPTNERLLYSAPELSRRRPDLVALRMARDGFDLRDFFFLHHVRSPKKAYQALFAVGAIDEDGKVTKVGKVILKLPFNVMYGRMIIEAHKFNVLSEVLTIIALLETEDIRHNNKRWRHLTSESRSDLLALLDIFQATEKVETPRVFSEVGLSFQAVMVARSFREYLFRTLQIPEKDRQLSQWNSIPERRQTILRACLAGMLDKPLLFRLNKEGYYKNGGVRYRLSKQSVVTDLSEWVIALPLNEPQRPAVGAIEVGTLDKATGVELRDLLEIAPHLLKEGWLPGVSYDPDQDATVASQGISFFGEVISVWRVVAPNDHPDPNLSVAFSNWFFGQFVLGGNPRRTLARIAKIKHPQLREVLEDNFAYGFELAGRNELRGRDLPNILTTNNGTAYLLYPRLGNARCLADITNWESFRFRNIDINDLLSEPVNNASTLNLGGREFSVIYQASQPPTITITSKEDGLLPNWEALLPDEGLFLPDGRPVAVRAKIGNLSQVQYVDLRKFKEAIRYMLSHYSQLMANQRAHRRRGLELLTLKKAEGTTEGE